MDDNRILTNKIFKQKINELVGADVVELEAANDDFALNCKVFETGMDALKTIISGGGSTITEKTLEVPIDFESGFTLQDVLDDWQNTSFGILPSLLTSNDRLIGVDYKIKETGDWVNVLDELMSTLGSSNNIIIPFIPFKAIDSEETEYAVVLTSTTSFNKLNSAIAIRLHYITVEPEE